MMSLVSLRIRCTFWAFIYSIDDNVEILSETVALGKDRNE